MSEEINRENITVLFRTFEELARDEEKIHADFHGDWDQAKKALEAANSAVPLAKVVTVDPRVTAMFDALKKLAKLMPQRRSEIEKMSADLTDLATRASNVQRDHEALTAEHQALKLFKAAVAKRDERMHGFGALARRSQRFANAQLRKV